MKRMIIISIALLIGGVLMSQTNEQKPNAPFAVYNIQNMVPDQVTAKPWPTPWYVIPARPSEFPNRPIAKPVVERMKTEALPPRFREAGRILVNMDPH